MDTTLPAGLLAPARPQEVRAEVSSAAPDQGCPGFLSNHLSVTGPHAARTPASATRFPDPSPQGRSASLAWQEAGQPTQLRPISPGSSWTFGGLPEVPLGGRHLRHGCDSASGLGSATDPDACTLPQGAHKSRKMTLLRGGGLRQLFPQESDPPGDEGAPQTSGRPFPGARED